MIKGLLVLLLLLVCKIIHWLLAHETIFFISKNMKNKIRERGLFHYTTKDVAAKIFSEQRLEGALDRKSTFPSHRNDTLIWFFCPSDSIVERFFRWSVLKRHSPLKHTGKNHSVKYEVKLLVKGISEVQIAHMKINIERGIGCYMDEMSGVDISYAELDSIDRRLGVG